MYGRHFGQKGTPTRRTPRVNRAEPLCHAVFTERLFLFLLPFHVERLPPPIITTFAPTGDDLSSTVAEGPRFDVHRHAYANLLYCSYLLFTFPPRWPACFSSETSAESLWASRYACLFFPLFNRLVLCFWWISLNRFQNDNLNSKKSTPAKFPLFCEYNKALWFRVK